MLGEGEPLAYINEWQPLASDMFGAAVGALPLGRERGAEQQGIAATSAVCSRVMASPGFW
jgi:hypothetical protein